MSKLLSKDVSARERLVLDRISLLKEITASMKAHKVTFPNITELSKECASRISEKQKSKCHHATLLRNDRYCHVLNLYMADALLAGSKNIKKSQIRDPAAKAMVIEKSAELTNCKEENKRLKAYTRNLQETVDNMHLIKKDAALSDGSDARKVKELENDLSQACVAIDKLLKHFPDIVTYDPIDKNIKDKSTRVKSKQVIVAEDDLLPYLKWYEMNKFVGS